MSVYSVYAFSGPAQRVEFTSGAMGQEEEIIAASWFKQLQEEGLIPQNARLGHRIRGYQSPGSTPASPAPIPTYRQALTAIVKELKAHDSDGDGLADFHIREVITKLEGRGIIAQATANQPLAQQALTIRKSPRQLIFFPPELTPFCAGRTPFPISLSPANFSTRFAGNPYRMSDVIQYFQRYAKAPEPELMQEIAAYLNAYYIHIDQTPLAGSNVSELLSIGRQSDLERYFTKYAGRAVIDCDIFAKVANLILGSLGIDGLSTSFVEVKYFGREKGHFALVVKKDGKPKWLVNNSTITKFSGGLDELVQMFTEDYYFLSQSLLVSWICQANTFAACGVPDWPKPEQALLNSPYASIRLNAAIFLAENPDPGAIDTLTQVLLKEANPQTRFYAARALAGSLQKAGAITPDQIDQLRANLAKEEDPQVQVEILKALYQARIIDQPQYVQGLKAALDRFAELYPSIPVYYDCNSKSCLARDIFYKITQLLFSEGDAGLAILGQTYDEPGLYAKSGLKITMRTLLLWPILGIDMNSPDLSKVKAPEAPILGLLKKALCQGKEYYAAQGLGILASSGNQRAKAILLEALKSPDSEVAALAAKALKLCI